MKNLLKLFSLLVIGFSPLAAKAVEFSTGPTIPLTELRLADPLTGKQSVALLGAGAGYQLSWGFFQTSLTLPGSVAKQYDLLDLDVMGFGQLTQEAGVAVDSASVALGLCTLNSLICLGFGSDLVQSVGGNMSGLLMGKVGKQNLFGLLSVGFNFGSGAPSSPPTGVDAGPLGLERGNTWRF